MRVFARLACCLAALAAVGAALARLGPHDWPASAGDVPRWLAAGPADTRVVALATVAAWGCLAWLAFVLVAVAYGAFPRGAVRDTAERVLGVAVVGVATGALVAGPAAADGPFDRPAGPAPPPRAPAAAGGPFDRPAVRVAPAPAQHPAGDRAASPTGAPRTEAARPPAGAPLPAGRPAAPPAGAPVPSPRVAVPPARAAPPGRAAGTVVVAPGDTLWGIAARRLGAAASPARTAATWPRWYAANRPVIGPDPDLIRPGQRLVPPTDGGQR